MEVERAQAGFFWDYEDGGRKLTRAEAQVFSIGYDEFPRMITVWEAGSAFLGYVEPQVFGHTGCFVVESGFGWNNGPTGRLNFCGQTFSPVDQVRTGRSANNGIRELWWNGWQ